MAVVRLGALLAAMREYAAPSAVPWHGRRWIPAVGTVALAMAMLGGGAAPADAALFGPQSTFPAGHNPWSVAVGDFNRDGHPDLAVANGGADSHAVSVLLGKGDGEFADPTSFDVGATQRFPRSVAVGDFNRDGKPDLAVANGGSNDVSVLLGDGHGGFEAATSFAVGDGPDSVAVGDFNRDGNPDLAVANDRSNNVSVLLGDGNGGFEAATSFAVGASPTSVAVGDFNRDGNPDLAVANFGTGSGSDGSGDVSVLLGDGEGGFGAATHFATGTDRISNTNPNAVAVGDFNADGLPDLAVANRNSDDGHGDVAVLVGDGHGGFARRANFLAGSRPFSVAAGDFDLDGHADVAVANEDSSDVSVLLGDGHGGFANAVSFAAGSEPFSIAVGDFNGDVSPDLAVANSGSDDVSVLLNTTAVGYTVSSTELDFGYQLLGFTTASRDLVVTADTVLRIHQAAVSGPDSDDFVEASDTCTGAMLGPAQSCKVQLRFAPEAAGESRATLRIASSRPGGDGLVPLAGTGFPVSERAQPGPPREHATASLFGPENRLSTGNGPAAVAAGDFDLDVDFFSPHGAPDLAVANRGSDDVSVLLGDGEGGFKAATSFAVGRSPRSVAVGDFNVDGKPDLAVANRGSDDVSVLLGDGEGRFAPATSVAAGPAPISVAVGDFNRDARADLVVVNSDGVSVLLGKGGGGFGPRATFAVGGLLPISVAVGDFNRDGSPDLAVADSGSANVSVLLGDGHGGFGHSTEVEAGASPSSVAVGDFNDNRLADLAVANQGSHNVSVLLGNGRGAFDPSGPFEREYAAGREPASLAPADLNGDRRPDLAVANSRSHNLSVLLGIGDIEGRLLGPTDFAAGDEPASVALADFNRDARPDLAVANAASNDVSVRLNTAAPAMSAPSELYLGQQRLGETGPPQDLTVTASGDAALRIADATVTGDNAGDFIKATDTCSGAVLALGESCRLQLRFSPSEMGTRSVVVRIRSNRPGEDALVPVFGIGLGPEPGPPEADGPPEAVNLPARLRINRAQVRGAASAAQRRPARRLVVRGALDPRAAGERLAVRFRARGRQIVLRPVVGADGQFAVSRRLRGPQRRARGGQLRVRFAGNDALRAAAQRLRAARRAVRLRIARLRLRPNGLAVAGRVAPRARRRARIQVEFNRPNGDPAEVAARARVNPRGRFRARLRVPPAVRNLGAWVAVTHPGRGRFFGQRRGRAIGG